MPSMLALGLEGAFEPVTRKVHERECLLSLTVFITYCMLLDKYRP